MTAIVHKHLFALIIILRGAKHIVMLVKLDISLFELMLAGFMAQEVQMKRLQQHLHG